MNSVVLIGNLTKDTELSYTPNTQTPCCRFTIAVNRPKKDGKDNGADYIRIYVWGKQAESCDKYLSKGRKVAVHGRITTGSYKDRNGQTVYTTDVTADNVEFLGGNAENSRSDGRNNGSDNSYQPPEYATQNENYGDAGFSHVDDDMPY